MLGHMTPEMLSDIRGLQAELLSVGRPRVDGAPPPRRGRPSRHEPLSPKTVKNIIGGSLRAMLRQARADEYVTRDLFAGHAWPKTRPPEPDPFTTDDVSRLLEWFQAKRFRTATSRGAGYVQREHPAYHAYLHLLFWTGMRPSEAAGLQWQDIDLDRSLAHVRRSRHLWEYGDTKTSSARRTVELFPQSVGVLRSIRPAHVEPEQPVFTHTRGEPIEPNSLLPHWYAAQRELGIRVRGLYSTKDTFVSRALNVGVKIAWLETQTGVNYTTLRRHYGKWMPLDGESELRRFETISPSLFQGPSVSGGRTRR